MFIEIYLKYKERKIFSAYIYFLCVKYIDSLADAISVPCDVLICTHIQGKSGEGENILGDDSHRKKKFI